MSQSNQLTQDQRNKFLEVCEYFSDLFTNKPGSYNGYYGKVHSKIDFIQKPPPNNKVYLPSYSDNMLKMLAEKMDQLEAWGVLV